MTEEYKQEEKDENVAKEPEVDYLANPIIDEDEHDLDNEECFVQLREELESFYAEDRLEHARHPIPEGCMSLEEFDKLLQKEIKERYAELP
ncbi:MAG: hypothetical protein IKT08_06895 [Bacteroidales bacterium]|nr:hypothetical protein [Bacteroidales bacterium]